MMYLLKEEMSICADLRELVLWNILPVACYLFR